MAAKKTPPVDTPPVETPPVDTPPVDTPPVETPPVDTPPVDTPPGAVRAVGYTVLDPLKHDGAYYGPAGNALGWPDVVELTPDQAQPLLAAGIVAAPPA